MLPEFYINDVMFSTKSVFQTSGIFLAVLIFTIVLWRLKGSIRDKIKFYIGFFLSLPFSFIGGSITRSLMYSHSIKDIFYNISVGTHFIGVIFFHLIIFSIVIVILLILKTKDMGHFFMAVPFYFTVIHFFSRLGCFFYGCCFGKPYNGIFSIKFPIGSVPVATGGTTLPVFPTQLFEAFSMLVLLVFMIFLCKKQINTMPFFMIFFGTVIIISESYMYQLGTRLIFGMSYPSFISILFILIGIYLFILTLKNKKNRRISKKSVVF